jgi:hypothetical protein
MKEREKRRQNRGCKSRRLEFGHSFEQVSRDQAIGRVFNVYSLGLETQTPDVP